MSAQFFTQEQKKEIIAAIRSAEKNTSGEIKLHVERKCKHDVLNRAVEIFHLLKLEKTKQRNAVLFYLATADHKFAIIGDKGINENVPENFWEELKNTVISHFKDEHFTEGLSKGIEMAGEKLKHFFPYQADDVNELSDDISINHN